MSLIVLSFALEKGTSSPSSMGTKVARLGTYMAIGERISRLLRGLCSAGWSQLTHVEY